MILRVLPELTSAAPSRKKPRRSPRLEPSPTTQSSSVERPRRHGRYRNLFRQRWHRLSWTEPLAGLRAPSRVLLYSRWRVRPEGGGEMFIVAFVTVAVVLGTILAGARGTDGAVRLAGGAGAPGIRGLGQRAPSRPLVPSTSFSSRATRLVAYTLTVVTPHLRAGGDTGNSEEGGTLIFVSDASAGSRAPHDRAALPWLPGDRRTAGAAREPRVSATPRVDPVRRGRRRRTRYDPARPRSPWWQSHRRAVPG